MLIVFVEGRRRVKPIKNEAQKRARHVVKPKILLSFTRASGCGRWHTVETAKTHVSETIKNCFEHGSNHCCMRSRRVHVWTAESHIRLGLWISITEIGKRRSLT